MTAPPQPLTVRFGRLPRRGLILGLSAPRVACIAGAVATVIPTLSWLGVNEMLCGLASFKGRAETCLPSQLSCAFPLGSNVKVRSAESSFVSTSIRSIAKTKTVHCRDASQ